MSVYPSCRLTRISRSKTRAITKSLYIVSFFTTSYSGLAVFTDVGWYTYIPKDRTVPRGCWGRNTNQFWHKYKRNKCTPHKNLKAKWWAHHRKNFYISNEYTWCAGSPAERRTASACSIMATNTEWRFLPRRLFPRLIWRFRVCSAVDRYHLCTDIHALSWRKEPNSPQGSMIVVGPPNVRFGRAILLGLLVSNLET